MRGLLAAIAFLTRIPVPSRVWTNAAQPPVQLPWYPVVGALIGALLWALATVLPHTSTMMAAALLLVAWVVLTGGLHLDGLADSADAWVGGLGDRARTLDIMKDPRSGPMGIIAIVLVLLLKFAALASQPQPSVALIIAPLLGRAALTLAFLTTPYVRSGGMGSALADAPRAACVATLAIAVLATVFAGRTAALAMVVTVVVFAGWRMAVMRRLGGMTGDTCGALAEVIETAVLVAWAL